MRETKRLICFLPLFLLASGIWAQPQTRDGEGTFLQAAGSVQEELAQSVDELTNLREEVANEKIPLSRRLSELEKELVDVRSEYQQTSRLLDSRTLDLSNLQSEIRTRQEEATYLSNLLGEYIRNFESRLHIAELQRYREPLEAAKLAPENSTLSEGEIYEAQAALLSVSLDRLHDALGGTRFAGTAVDPAGLVKSGTFVLVGPAALFHAADGSNVGTVEQRLGSLEPSIVPFGNEEDAQVASEVLARGSGLFPVDPTLGNAHKIEETKETLIGHIQKGGPVMVPIFVLAGTALLVAIFKWLSMAFIRTPSKKRVRKLLDLISRNDRESAMQQVSKMRGPVGEMLAAGVEQLHAPRELIEEVMYEKVLAARLKLERFLPFIAICAASAPLLGLLGTVTGIINTFKLITVFGSGDVKTLSGGISEALITTEFGLIVAIPSLLLHAFLSRKARGIINQMEKGAVALVNQIGKAPFQRGLSHGLLRDTVEEGEEPSLIHIHSEGRQRHASTPFGRSGESVREIMDSRLVSVCKSDTVSETINKIRSSRIHNEMESVFVVDEKGKYFGHVLLRHLLTRPEETRVEALTNTSELFVRIDTDRDEVKELFNRHDVAAMPVLDGDDRLVGCIKRNGDG